MTQAEYVWMIEENVRALVISRGAYASKVEFSLEGNRYITIVDNNEFYEMGEELDDDEG